MFRIIIIFLFIIITNPAYAQDQDCKSYEFYYLEKKDSCIELVIKSLEQKKNEKYGIKNSLVPTGFLSGVFSYDKSKIDFVLQKEVSEFAKGVFISSLYLSDNKDRAKKYAELVNMYDIYQDLEKSKAESLKKISSNLNPATNDLLINAFMASGDEIYIKNILKNFTKASDETAMQSIRMALLNSKFGPNLLPQNRFSKEKHPVLKLDCKKNIITCMSIFVNSSGFWALKSLSKKHKKIADIFEGFFKNDQRLNKILLRENMNFVNYITLSIIDTKDLENSNKEAMQEIENFLIAYESFEEVEVKDLKNFIKRNNN